MPCCPISTILLMPVIEIKIPAMGESITEGTVASWLKKPGEFVNRDEAIVEIETDKVTQEIYATESATIREILRNTGESARVGEAFAMFDASPCYHDLSSLAVHGMGVQGTNPGPAMQNRKELVVSDVTKGVAFLKGFRFDPVYRFTRRLAVRERAKKGREWL